MPYLAWCLARFRGLDQNMPTCLADWPKAPDSKFAFDQGSFSSYKLCWKFLGQWSDDYQFIWLFRPCLACDRVKSSPHHRIERRWWYVSQRNISKTAEQICGHIPPGFTANAPWYSIGVADKTIHSWAHYDVQWPEVCRMWSVRLCSVRRAACWTLHGTRWRGECEFSVLRWYGDSSTHPYGSVDNQGAPSSVFDKAMDFALCETQRARRSLWISLLQERWFGLPHLQKWPRWANALRCFSTVRWPVHWFHGF